MLVGPRRSAILVDPAWTPEELDGLAADLAALRLTVVAGISSHSHFDHLLWHPAWGEVPRWGSPATAAAPRAPMLDELGSGFPPSAFLTAPPLAALPERLPWSGSPVVPIVTDAHAPGHTSLWLPRLRVLIAGDLLSDIEPPLLSEEDPDGVAYRAGLDRLEPFAARAALVIPGHGSPGGDALARLRRDQGRLEAMRETTSSGNTDETRKEEHLPERPLRGVHP